MSFHIDNSPLNWKAQPYLFLNTEILAETLLGKKDNWKISASLENMFRNVFDRYFLSGTEKDIRLVKGLKMPKAKLPPVIHYLDGVVFLETQLHA